MNRIKLWRKTAILSLSIAMVLACSSPSAPIVEETETPQEYLNSWNDNPLVKDRILSFLESVSNESSDQFIPSESRVAVFDNDGTLWAEQPLYFQLFFAMDRIKMMAEDHPEWKDQEPFESILNNNPEEALKGGTKAILEVVMNTHSGMTSEEFRSVVKEWADTATNPVTQQRYIDMIYQPMQELINALEEHDFKVFIVSGGGVDFMRAWAPEVYGIPTERIIGSSIKMEYHSDSLHPEIEKLAELDFIDDKEGKPIGIEKFIGKRPVVAVGNSDGDFQMLEWTTTAQRPSLGILLHHTDSVREFAYDHPSHIGHLQRGLNQADARGWIVIDMAQDWSSVWP